MHAHDPPAVIAQRLQITRCLGTLEDRERVRRAGDGHVGAVVGGWLLGALGIYAGGLIGTIVVAIVGAIFLIWLSRLIKKA